MKKILISVVILTILYLSNIATTFSQSVDHTAEYHFEGEILFEKQVGHYCNTGSEQKQVIKGTGELNKIMTLSMIKGYTVVTDENDFKTAQNSVHNLTITSLIRLCSPPKFVYDVDGIEYTVSLNELYREADQQPHIWAAQQDGWFDWSDYVDEWESISSQIWAVQVEAKPGESGFLDQDYESAFGPYRGQAVDTAREESWRLSSDGSSARRGSDYVGDYFRINQKAGTSSGVMKRFIDISSPWSHGYVYEDATISGTSEVRDRFRMRNIRAGSDLDPKWYELF